MATRAWKFAGGHSWPVDAQEAGDELDRIREANGGGLRPESVVEAARDPENILHDCFEWDDSKAAERYRRGEAAHLIRSIRVIRVIAESGEKQEIRAYARVLPIGADVHQYLPIAIVAAEPSLLNQAINDAVSDLAHAESRLSEFRSLRQETVAIKEVRLALQKHKEQRPRSRSRSRSH